MRRAWDIAVVGMLASGALYALCALYCHGGMPLLLTGAEVSPETFGARRGYASEFWLCFGFLALYLDRRWPSSQLSSRLTKSAH